MRQIVSFGGGTNSVAMAIGMVQGREMIDALVFADTGGEKPETYAYIHTMNLWLRINGYPEIVTVRSDNPHRTLEQECLARNTLPSIAFGFKSCSDKWKQQPFKKWLKTTGWTDVTVCIGFDAGEPHRAKRGDEHKEKYAKRYPLIEWGMEREECIALIKNMGLPLPGKSACFFCPSSKKHEILALAPDLQERAIAMERNASVAHTVKGLGRRWSWESLIAADKAQQNLFQDSIQEIPCGCFDGEES